MRLEEEKKKHAAHIVLIVDDDAASRQAMHKCLAHTGRIVEVADTALLSTTYQQFLPNLVLMDAKTSLNGGGDMVKDILAYDPEAFIVILSADCTQQSILDSKNRGAKGFICKPFNRDILLKYASLAGIAKPRAPQPSSKQQSTSEQDQEKDKKDVSHASA